MTPIQSNTRNASGRRRSLLGEAGLTLVELMIVLLMTAIVIGLAAPSLRGWILQQHLSTTTNSLISAFHLARQTAIQSQRPVSLCAGQSGACHGRANWDWSKGWIVFIDYNRNGILDGEEMPIYTGHGAHADLIVTANAPLTKSVIFTSLGFAEQPGGAFSAGRLRICAPMPIFKNARDLVLAKSGRLRLEESDFSGACPAP